MEFSAGASVRRACKGGFRSKALVSDSAGGLMKATKRIGGHGASNGRRIQSSKERRRRERRAAEEAQLESNRSARNA